MPCHPDRVHALLSGYQFGDAASLRQAEPRLLDAVEGARFEIGDTIRIRLGSAALAEIQRADQPLPLDEQ